VTGPYEHGNEYSGSRKGWDFMDQLGNSELISKGSAPCSLLGSSFDEDVLSFSSKSCAFPALL